MFSPAELSPGFRLLPRLKISMFSYPQARMPPDQSAHDLVLKPANPASGHTLSFANNRSY
jgi:hypothetical protein